MFLSGTDLVNSEGGKCWNAGGTIDLPDLVDQIRRDFSDFDRLKSECGGLQTLLRNHSSIFVVRGKAVRFLSPEELSVDYWRSSEAKRRKKGGKPAGQHDKVRDCWFFAHHPNGCPLKADSCRYIHNPPSVLADTINQLWWWNCWYLLSGLFSSIQNWYRQLNSSTFCPLPTNEIFKPIILLKVDKESAADDGVNLLTIIYAHNVNWHGSYTRKVFSFIIVSSHPNGLLSNR